jgi:hypothetical protein
MQFKHKLLIAFVLAWFAFRMLIPKLLFTYMFAESLLLLDAGWFIGIIYLADQRKRL